MNCPECDTDLPENSAFCLQCGAQLGEGLPAPADPLLQALEQAIGSQYEIVRLLGRGGMGAVYLGRDQALDRLVAIKVLPPESTDTESIERFRREARTAAKLTHPNIVPLYTFGEGEGILYFVMGYVPGESLRDRIKRVGRIEPGEARRILVEIAGALHYAHEQNVVHRDVKPDNILLEDDTGKPMLTDFGVAKMTVGGETLTALGTALGTPFYMSPEQAAGEKEIDGRSDLYSLGVIGYQMLAGQLPFEGETVQDVLMQHMTKEPIHLKTLSPSAPGDLADVVSRCMAKTPDDRPFDGQALQRYLDASGAEDELPDDLAALVEYIKPLPWVSGGLGYMALAFLLWGEPGAAAGFFTMGGLLPLAVVAERTKRKLGKHSWRSILRHVLRKPKWWIGWWPKAFGGPGDLWERLPKPIRRARNYLVGMGASLPFFLLLIARTGLGAPSLFWVDVVPNLIIAIGAPPFALLSWHTFRYFRWAKKQGLPPAEWDRLLGATDGELRFWKQPHIQKLLAPAQSADPFARFSTPRNAAEYVAALTEASASMSGAEREIAHEAASAGREIAGALETLERQIADLAKEADPAERAHVEQRLQELGAELPGESEGLRRMRDLVKQQLELSQHLAAQLAAAAVRRDRLLDLLKTLWLQVCNLKTRAESALDSGEISAKIHAITEDIQRYVEAVDETVKLLGE